MLGKYVVPLYEEQMVEHLLDQIMSPNTEFKTEVNICRSSNSPKFVKNPLTCLQWLQDSIHLPTLHQASSQSVVFMLLAVDTGVEEEVDGSMIEVVVDDIEE